MTTSMERRSTLDGKTVLITGANRGLGQALVTEALDRGAARVYAAARHQFDHPDPRVSPVTLDVTNPQQIQDAAKDIDSLDILINNAGISVPDDLSGRVALETHLAVNLYGTLDVTQAFVPALSRDRGAVINIVSLGAVAAVPVLPAYSISKAAALSLTQSMRALLAARGVRVHAVLAGPIDTDMVRELPIPKTSPRSAAAAIFDGLDKGESDIFPDPASDAFAAGWRSGVTASLEKQNAALLATAAQ